MKSSSGRGKMCRRKRPLLPRVAEQTVFTGASFSPCGVSKPFLYQRQAQRTADYRAVSADHFPVR
jgi:hypothetical protein